MEKGRSFSTKRASKLLKYLVNTLAILGGIYSVYLFFSRERIVNMYLDISRNCPSEYLPSEYCTDQFANNMQFLETHTNIALFLFLGLPALFYGISSLYHYLYPSNQVDN